MQDTNGLSQEQILEIKLAGIRSFFRSSRKAGLLTMIYDNCGATTVEEFSDLLANRYSSSGDTDSQEFKMWKDFFSRVIKDSEIRTLDNVKEAVQKGGWDCDPENIDEEIRLTQSTYKEFEYQICGSYREAPDTLEVLEANLDESFKRLMEFTGAAGVGGKLTIGSNTYSYAIDNGDSQSVLNPKSFVIRMGEWFDKRLLFSVKARRCQIMAQSGGLSFDELYDRYE